MDWEKEREERIMAKAKKKMASGTIKIKCSTEEMASAFKLAASIAPRANSGL
ncbi:unnamed protein product, partial [marine sediment metagenome]